MAAFLFAAMYSSPARADSDPEAEAALFDVAIVVPALALSMPNLIHIVNGEKPPIGWTVTGIGLGALGVGLNSLALAETHSRTNPTLAIGGIAGSALVIGLAIWAWAQPSRAPRQAAATPPFLAAPFFWASAHSGTACGVTIEGRVF